MKYCGIDLHSNNSVQPTGLNGMARHRHQFAVLRIARNVSQQGIGADISAATDLGGTIGHVSAPTFFWGSEAARATGSDRAARLILMGVWRDSSQPGVEETDAVGNCERIGRIDGKQAACAAMNLYARLTLAG